MLYRARPAPIGTRPVGGREGLPGWGWKDGVPGPYFLRASENNERGASEHHANRRPSSMWPTTGARPAPADRAFLAAARVPRAGPFAPGGAGHNGPEAGRRPRRRMGDSSRKRSPAISAGPTGPTLRHQNIEAPQTRRDHRRAGAAGVGDRRRPGATGVSYRQTAGGRRAARTSRPNVR